MAELWAAPEVKSGHLPDADGWRSGNAFLPRLHQLYDDDARQFEVFGEFRKLSFGRYQYAAMIGRLK